MRSVRLLALLAGCSAVPDAPLDAAEVHADAMPSDSGSVDAGLVDASADVDASLCGNGVLDPGETCDIAVAPGARFECPTHCDGAASCTTEMLAGSDCTAACRWISAACSSGDGCCPTDCSADTDCAAAPPAPTTHSFTSAGADRLTIDLIAFDGTTIAVTGHGSGSFDFGGGPLSAAASGETFLATFDAAGHHLSSRFFSGPSAPLRPIAIALDATENVVLLGTANTLLSSTTIDFGGGELALGLPERAYFIVSFDRSGVHRWSRALLGTPGYAHYPGEDFLAGARLATTPSGDVILAGMLSGSFDLGAGCISQRDSGDEGHSAILAVEFAGDGSGCRWSQVYDSTSSMSAHSAVGGVSVAPAGTIVMTVDSPVGATYFNGAHPYLNANVVALEATGALRWVRNFDMPHLQFDSVVADDDIVLVAGSPWVDPVDLGSGPLSAIAVPPGRDAILAAFALSDGASRWSRRWSGPGDDSVVSFDASSSRVAALLSFEHELAPETLVGEQRIGLIDLVRGTGVTSRALHIAPFDSEARFALSGAVLVTVGPTGIDITTTD